MAPGMDMKALLAEFAEMQERVRDLESRSAISRDALEQLAAGAPIGLVVLDPQLRYQFINEYLADLHGLKPQDCLGRTLREIAGSSADQLEPLYARVLETGSPVTVELTLPRPPGSIGRYVVSYYPLRDSEGGTAGVCGAVRDVTSARAAEMRLHESERRYRDLAESLNEFVWSENAAGSIEYANPHAIRYAGIEHGADWRIAIHPDDAETLRREISRSAGDIQIELRIRRAADGEYRWHLARIARIEDDSRPVRLLGTAIDIHDRKREEQARALLASIVESSLDSIIGVDLEGRITSWNPAAEKLFGYREEQVIGRSVAVLRLAQSEEDLRDMLARVARGEVVESQETIRATADGRELQVFISFAPIRDETGRVTGAFKTVRDVTAQRRAERAMRAANERFRIAQKALHAGVWEIDLVTGETHWSPEVYELAGLDPSLTPSPELWLTRVHPDDVARVRRNIKRSRETHDDLRHQFRIIRNGQIRWITSFGQVTADPGRSPRLVGISIDTTDLHAAEEAVRQVTRFESIARLAGGVAHDFNNLLAGIMGGASFIAEVLPEEHTARSMLDLIIRSSERAAQLTRQLLAYAGQGTFAPRRLDLSTAVQEACSLTRGSIPARVELSVQTGWQLPHIEADPNQIREVVLGLISNATEAIGEIAGSISVRTGLERLDRAAIGARFSGTDLAPGSYVYLEVQDSGPGMPQEVVNRIFEPFFTTKFMGRGLGLSAIQGIVRGHRGAIEVETKPGAGARFRIYFPAAAEAPAHDSARMPEQKRHTVLVIDDEDAVRDVVRVALSRAGYSVLTASDGLAGLETLRSREAQISLVILDVSMPKMSGGEVLDEMRRRGTKVKVLITSGYPEGDALARLPKETISGFLQKPFTVQQLSALIASVLSEAAAAG